MPGCAGVRLTPACACGRGLEPGANRFFIEQFFCPLLVSLCGTWFDPTLVTYWYRSYQWDVRARAANEPREQYVADSLRAFWKGFEPKPDRPEVRRALTDSYDRFLAITRILHREGVRFLVGTDLAAPLVYPGATVHEELGWLVKAGLSPIEALVARTRHGAAAIRAIECGEHNCMVALQASTIVTVPLSVALSAMKSVPLESDVIQSARDIGISFGDEG